MPSSGAFSPPYCLVTFLNSLIILEESKENNPVKQIRKKGISNIIPTSPCPVWSLLMSHMVSKTKRPTNMKENSTIIFLAGSHKKNIPTPKTKSINPQHAYNRHVVISLQPLEEGKKNSIEMNPIVAATVP